MSRTTSGFWSQVTEAIGQSWNQFWFTPADPLPCCALRVGVGLVAIAHFVAVGIDLERWYGSQGLLTPSAVTTLLTATGVEANYHFTYFDYLTSRGELWGAHACAIAAAIVFVLGLSAEATLISGLCTLLALLAYVHRVPQVAGYAEPVLAFLLAYLCIAPASACLSIGSLLRRRRAENSATPLTDERSPSLRANLALRLIQVHLAMFYAMMGLSKLYGDAWWDGMAIWQLLAQTESRPLNLTGLRSAGQLGEYILNVWTLSVPYFELAFPVLIWNRLARPILLGLGVIIWGGLILATGNLLFGLTMIVSSLAFVSPEFLAEFLPGRSPTLARSASEG